MAKTRKTIQSTLLKTLTKEITAGKYSPDRTMPSENDFCKRFEISRPTIRLVLSKLEHQGLIYRRHGKGTFVHAVMPRQINPIALLLREPAKLASPYIMDIIHGSNSYMSALGSNIIVVDKPPSKWSAKFTQSIEGVIILPAQLPQSEVDLIANNHKPYMIMMESDLKGPTVKMNPSAMAFALAEKLIKLGHRRFGLISGHDQHSDKQRKSGITKALKNAKIPASNIRDIQTNYDLQAGEQAAKELLQLKTNERPTAIIAFDDCLAAGAISIAKNFGLNVPKDVSIVGFTDSPFSVFLDPPLTTVRFPAFEAGRKSVEAIIKANKENKPVRSLTLKSEIIWRKSASSSPKNKT